MKRTFNSHFVQHFLYVIAVFFVVAPLSVISQTPAYNLEEGFAAPPSGALPRTWWHWTNSNVTKEGITKDLEWMKRSGIGGFQLADVASGSGQTVDDKLLFMTPEWLDAVRHAASEADRLGLEMTVFSSAGWSLTGGPWVKPEQAMKKLVWSERIVKGPLDLSGKLPSPPGIEGPVRNLSRSGRVQPSDPQFYKDCAVLAFPLPPDEVPLPEPEAITGRGPVDPEALVDDDLNTSVTIKKESGASTIWIEYSFREPVTIRAVTLANRAGIPVGSLKAGNGGSDYTTVAILPGAQLYRSGKVMTLSFPAVTASHYRFEFTGAPMRPAEVMSETILQPDSAYVFGEIKLHSSSRVNRWEDKAGFYHLFNYEPVKSDQASAGSVILPQNIIDLTSLLQPDGSINWKVPPGNWKIMRFGYSLTGSKNRPAVPAGLGYEVDKLSREHTMDYIVNYIDPYREALGPLFGKSMRYVLLDSWEAGMQNWTDAMPEEFYKRRGYNLTPFLPALAGYVVGNSDICDRVLWDFRRTLADMFAENHFKVISDYLHDLGIGTYGEVSGVSLEILEDALLCKKYVDIPMGEFWYRALHPELMYYQDVRGAASASHIYGKNLVAAEAYTGGGFESPYTLKKIGDYWFTQGINRFVFHTSAHQPLDTKPGNTMVGTHINRNITWAEQANPFMTYLARNSFMLQQGLFVADLVYLLGEGAPSTMPIWGQGLSPAPPEGYDYDYINADALISRMTVSSDGKLTMPDGMSYSVLVLPDAKYMTLPVLRKIESLVREGATVIGSPPAGTPGLTGYPQSETEAITLVKEIWGDLDGISRTVRDYGKGKVIWGQPLKKALEIKGILPDIEYGRPLDARVNWIHRKSVTDDIYLVVNSGDKPLNTDIRFRISGKKPEMWDPATGERSGIPFSVEGNRTTIAVEMDERESFFIVFRDAEPPAMVINRDEQVSGRLNIGGPWRISFTPGSGAPAEISSDSPELWNKNTSDGIKYYSGTAGYKTEFIVSQSFIKGGTKFCLDLGRVFDIAEVTINGISLPLMWKYPYVADVTGLLRKGQNTLEIKVTNQWTNRLAGDQKLPPAEKVLKSPLFVFGSSLRDSGLQGPVNIVKYQ